MAVGKNITWEKGKGKQYRLSFNIDTVGKNIRWGKGKETENSGKKSRFKRKGMGKNINLKETLYTPAKTQEGLVKC